MERDELIERFRSGPAEVRDALAGAGDAELDRAPAAGWTARRVVHHLADSEVNGYLRLRRLLAEDRPTLAGWDESHYADVLHYDRPIDTSLAVFEVTRSASAELLDRLSETEWQREGTHAESGRYTVDDWLRIYANHAYAHADQIRRARRGEP